MTVALAQTGSDRSPSMVGASLGSMRTAMALGRTNPVDAVSAGWAAAQLLIHAKKSTAGAKLAPRPKKLPLNYAPGVGSRPILFCVKRFMTDGLGVATQMCQKKN